MNFFRWREFHCLAASRLLLHIARRALVPFVFLIRIIPLRAQICGACRPSRVAFSGHAIHKLLYFPRRDAIRRYDVVVFDVVELTFRMLGTHFLSLVLCVFLPLNRATHYSISESTISKRLFVTWFFCKMHRVAGATIPMVRRTSDFIATKSILKHFCVLTFLVCSAWSVT